MLAQMAPVSGGDMPKQITVLCPHHLANETIALPTGYSDNYDGLIPCGDPDSKRLLMIKLSAGNVMGVQFAKNDVGNGGPDKQLMERLKEGGGLQAEQRRHRMGKKPLG